MSQIGIDTHVAETIIINSSAHNRLPGEDNFDENGRYMQAFIDYNTARGVTLLTFSIIGLLGNVLTILLVAVAPRLRKPQNSFFVHQCILDAVKSAYCLVFSKSLLEREAPSECAILGASYIVLVTTTAFNILAIMVNEIYHFTSTVVGIQPSNRCCVLFGLGVTWSASIIINLGVAFLPGNSSFDRTLGYCTFMYGITGNYLLHVIWIVLITIALLMTVFYLRKFWIDIKKREFQRLAYALHESLVLQLDECEKIVLHPQNTPQALQTATHNFYILSGMVLTFVCFWYPLFLLALSDPTIEAKPHYYKTLTLFAWCHSSLTPLFFLGYNISSLKKRVKNSESCTDIEVTDYDSKDTNSLRHQRLTSESDSTPISPLRPSSLNVTPSYRCHFHFPSGLCVEDEKHGDAHLQLQASAESIEDILANHQHLTSTLEALDDVVQKRSHSVKVSSKTPKFKTTDTIRLKRSFSENGRIAKFAKNFTTTVSVGDHQQGITKFERAKNEVLSTTNYKTKPRDSVLTSETESNNSRSLPLLDDEGLTQPRCCDSSQQTNIPNVHKHSLQIIRLPSERIQQNKTVQNVPTLPPPNSVHKSESGCLTFVPAPEVRQNLTAYSRSSNIDWV